MERSMYRRLESFMQTCMGDSAHDRAHIYRVLYTAMEIARCEKDVDADVLIAACLLHDVGRREQFANPVLDHAEVGAEKARRFLLECGWDAALCTRISQCIQTHRFRSDCPPESLEARILFDADKLDVTGAMGIARTLLYNGAVGEPLYSVGENGTVFDGSGDAGPSFFREYQFKLKGLYARFYTARGAELAAQRQEAAVSFYEELLNEVQYSYRNGAGLLAGRLTD